MNIFVLDDFKQDREMLTRPFTGAHDVRSAGDLDEAKRVLENWWPDVALLDAIFPPRRNEPPKFMAEAFLEFLESKESAYPFLPQVILVSGQTDAARRFDSVRQWLSYGRIADVLPKSTADIGKTFFTAVIQFRVETLLERQRWKRVQSSAESDSDWFQQLGISTRSPAILSLRKHLIAAAKSRLCVLLCGQMGCGKELFARAIHSLGRPGKPFQDADCSAIPTELFETEMFGIEGTPGGQTYFPKKGLLEEVGEGTVLLDEVQNLEPKHQSKLRHVLQEGNFRKVGGIKDTEFRGKLIAATNVDLRQMVERGEFREDLYYRMSGFTIEIPTLEERIEDVPLLVDQFLSSFAHGREKHDGTCPSIRISAKCLSSLVNYRWPGNVRELRAVIFKCAEFALGAPDAGKEAEITIEMLQEYAPQLFESVSGGNPRALGHDALLNGLDIGVYCWLDIGPELKDKVRDAVSSRLSAEGRVRLSAMETALQPRQRPGDPDCPGRNAQYPETIHCLKGLLFLLLHADNQAEINDIKAVCGVTWDPAKRVMQVLGASAGDASPKYDPFIELPGKRARQRVKLLDVVKQDRPAV